MRSFEKLGTRVAQVSFRLVNKSLALSLRISFVLHLVAAVGSFFAMEDTVKALEEKVAKLAAKLGKKSKSMAGTSSNSPITSPENLLCIKPESFLATSGESWMVWMRKFKSIAALNKWSSERQVQILPVYLKGLAEETCYSLTTEQTATWTAVERALKDRFHPKESRQVNFSTLRAK